ncbi:nuclear transport factor 2 family protein [bacterium]|nr:nuclear transport factor 2 family protein [bacterium]
MGLIEDYYQRFNSADWEGMLSLLDEEIVHEVSQGQVQHGKSAFRQFLGHMELCYREQVSQLCVFTQADRAAAEFWLDGEYLRTDSGLPEARGQKYRLRVGSFFEVRQGLITRVSVHYNLKDWLAQVQ